MLNAQQTTGVIADNLKIERNGEYMVVDKMCLGVGRFPIRTVTEATQMVDKTISYMENKDSGSWKNNVTFVADDGNNEDSFTLEFP